MKSYSLFQYLSICLSSMTFRESVMLICLLVMVLFILVFLEQLTRVMVLAAVLFAIYKAVTSVMAFLVNQIRGGHKDENLGIPAYCVV